MLVPNQMIKILWNYQNKKYYVDKGYEFTGYNDLFLVRAEDLSNGSSASVKIICDYCGTEYDVPWYRHVKTNRKNQKNACYNCRAIKQAENSLLSRQSQLYSKALTACEEKGYILISDKSEILRNTSYIKYLCPLHGEHSMKVANLISGKGCPDCVSLNNSERFRLSPDEVEKRIRVCGGQLLNKADYKNQTEKNLLVVCFECGSPFLTSLRNYTQHGGQVCDDCRGIESVGEKRIRNYLENNKIEFIPQKWFSDCRDINPLPFDFYLPNHNVLIEFDGRQHFGETDYFTYSFEETKKHDEIKNNYCKANGIYLMRIPYWKADKIEEILDKELILHEDIV